MDYWLSGHVGERKNYFSKIQLVGRKYRNKTTLASKTRFSRHCFGFQSRRFSLLVGYNIQPSSNSTNQNAALIIDHYWAGFYQPLLKQHVRMTSANVKNHAHLHALLNWVLTDYSCFFFFFFFSLCKPDLHWSGTGESGYCVKNLFES